MFQRSSVYYSLCTAQGFSIVAQHLCFRKAQPKHCWTSIFVRPFAPRPSCILTYVRYSQHLLFVQISATDKVQEQNVLQKNGCQKRPNKYLSFDWSKLKCQTIKIIRLIRRQIGFIRQQNGFIRQRPGFFRQWTGLILWVLKTIKNEASPLENVSQVSLGKCESFCSKSLDKLPSLSSHLCTAVAI